MEMEITISRDSDDDGRTWTIGQRAIGGWRAVLIDLAFLAVLGFIAYAVVSTIIRLIG